MHSSSQKHQTNRALASEWRKSKMGYDFDVNADCWQLDGSSRVCFNTMRSVDEGTEIGFRLALSRYAQELSAATVLWSQKYFYNYCDSTSERTINVTGLTNWRASLSDDDEYRLGALKSFLISWYEWGFPGVDREVVDFLDELRLRGNVKGKAVKGACPHSGPFTPQEQGALIDWASNAFSENTLTLKEYAFFLALMFTGRRAVQIRALSACDLVAKEGRDGREYVINIPRAKQRGVGFREAFSSLPVVEDLYLLLNHQAKASQKIIEDAHGVSLPNHIKRRVPVFLEERRVGELTCADDISGVLDQKPDYLHLSQSSSFSLVGRIKVKNTAVSERTGDFINFTSRRFRYTKGTNLARRGIQGVALAMALDQSDTQQISHYVENTAETAKQIDEIMAPVLAPLAQAFAGKLIASEREALRSNDPHSRVKNGETNNIGNCGTHNFCVQGYRACYTCSSFQPWIDAPHEEVRAEILSERERQKNHGVSKFVIQSTDRLLLAVEQVIQMCASSKSEASTEGENG